MFLSVLMTARLTWIGNYQHDANLYWRDVSQDFDGSRSLYLSIFYVVLRICSLSGAS